MVWFFVMIKVCMDEWFREEEFNQPFAGGSETGVDFWHQPTEDLPPSERFFHKLNFPRSGPCSAAVGLDPRKEKPDSAVPESKLHTPTVF